MARSPARTPMVLGSTLVSSHVVHHGSDHHGLRWPQRSTGRISGLWSTPRDETTWRARWVCVKTREASKPIDLCRLFDCIGYSILWLAGWCKCLISVWCPALEVPPLPPKTARALTHSQVRESQAQGAKLLFGGDSAALPEEDCTEAERARGWMVLGLTV